MPRGVLNCSAEGRVFNRKVPSVTGEHYFEAHQIHDIFTTIVKAFSSSAAVASGIVRRACNFGLTGTGSTNISRFSPVKLLNNPGTGFGRWDESTHAGNNAWALFEFTQATVPFWVLVQFSALSIDLSKVRFGESPGNSGYVQSLNYIGNGFGSQVKQNSVAIAIGMMNDGSSPWNGTTNNDGSDAKSNPVWKTSAIKFPRGNDERAWESATSDRLIPIVHEVSINLGASNQLNSNAIAYDSLDLLYHVIFDKDNFFIFFDVNGQGSAGSIFYFGKYISISDSLLAPYVCLYRNTSFDDSYSSITIAENGSDTTNVPYGCINTNTALDNTTFLKPYIDSRQPINGGVNDPIGQHTVGCVLNLPTSLANIFSSSDLFWSVDSSVLMKFQTVNPDLYMYEYPDKYGYLGKISFFKIVRNIKQGSYFANGNELIVGNPSMSSYKLVIPWDANTDYGLFGNRYGTMW